MFTEKERRDTQTMLSNNPLQQSNAYETTAAPDLPSPLDLGAISRSMQQTNNSETDENEERKSSMINMPDKNYTVSDTQFGSFFNYTTQGIVLMNKYNFYEGKDVQNTLHPMGPGIRFLQFVNGVEPEERMTPDQSSVTPEYQYAAQQAQIRATQICKQIRRSGYENPPIQCFNVEDMHLFRMGKPVNEPDDDKLKKKIIKFHTFVLSVEADKFAKRVNFRQIEDIQKPWVFPNTFEDIEKPSMTKSDGTAFTMENYLAEHVELSDGELRDEYVPEIARNEGQRHVVFGMYPSPTLLNCIDESKYLAPNLPSSPFTKEDFDEAILIKPMRAFRTPEQAAEFKDNFAKHELPEASIHIGSTNVRLPLLDLYTEWHKRNVPRTFHKEAVQHAMVDMPEAAKMKREMAKAKGYEVVHFGPEQTEEEATQAMARFEAVARANNRIAKTTKMMQRVMMLRQKISKNKSDTSAGGGGSKE